MDKKIYVKQYAAAIIDVFEDFLDERGVVIPNSQRDEDGDMDAANIWGEDFGQLMDTITETLRELADAARASDETDTENWGS